MRSVSKIFRIFQNLKGGRFAERNEINVDIVDRTQRKRKKEKERERERERKIKNVDQSVPMNSESRESENVSLLRR